ncbi:hypothetical protein [Ottowia sp.]|uniref:hypothetical protein n=1 Tax=Ottowia sp. TaxID=1898956 RepID=UPI0025F66D2E|nr:hypothetical protein [Ottowia sp.]MBK6616364.1 hypothetical protein [Ottowia sp.]
MMGAPDEMDAAPGGRCWITDMGSEVEVSGHEGSELLPRYGVWNCRFGDRKPRVLAVSNDLQDLMKRFGVPPERVFPIHANPASPGGERVAGIPPAPKSGESEDGQEGDRTG